MVFVCLGSTNIVPVILFLPNFFAHLEEKCFITRFHYILTRLLPIFPIPLFVFQICLKIEFTKKAPCREDQDQAWPLLHQLIQPKAFLFRCGQLSRYRQLYFCHFVSNHLIPAMIVLPAKVYKNAQHQFKTQSTFIIKSRLSDFSFESARQSGLGVFDRVSRSKISWSKVSI